MDTVIDLLKEAIDKSYKEHPDKVILLDGFPREINQAKKFEKKVIIWHLKTRTYILNIIFSIL